MTIMSLTLRRKCIDVIASYGAVRLTVPQFEELLAADRQLEKDLIEFDSPSDTADRERLLEAVAVMVVGRPWPCNMEGQAVADQFFIDYAAALKSKGYTLVK